MMKNCREYIAWLLLCCLSGGVAAEPAPAGTEGFTKEQLEWLESEKEHPAIEINEGELEFLADGPDKPEHHHENHIWITRKSIETGWARLEQCHTDLDAVPSLQIVYNEDRVREIKIVSTRNIGHASVYGHKVLLENIARGSKICLEAHSNVLQPAANQHFTVRNGPFMRQFLDGYYPITVTLNIHYPETMLKLITVNPAPQSGWKVEHMKNEVMLKGRFKGRLKTNLLFKRLAQSL